MIRLVRLVSAACSFWTFAATATWAQAEPPRWEVYAGCAAAYQANWQLRQALRAPDMSNQIKDQVEEFKGKAIGFYESDNRATGDGPRRRVEDYMAANLERFLAMERAGTLEAYIDQCPPE